MRWRRGSGRKSMRAAATLLLLPILASGSQGSIPVAFSHKKRKDHVAVAELVPQGMSELSARAIKRLDQGKLTSSAKDLTRLQDMGDLCEWWHTDIGQRVSDLRHAVTDLKEFKAILTKIEDADDVDAKRVDRHFYEQVQHAQQYLNLLKAQIAHEDIDVNIDAPEKELAAATFSWIKARARWIRHELPETVTLAAFVDVAHDLHVMAKRRRSHFGKLFQMSQTAFAQEYGKFLKETSDDLKETVQHRLNKLTAKKAKAASKDKQDVARRCQKEIDDLNLMLKVIA